MSARRPANADLAIIDVRPAWVPQAGDRVRRINQTRLAQVANGTARVLEVRADRRTVCVALDPRPDDASHASPRWVTWPLTQTLPATDTTE